MVKICVILNSFDSTDVDGRQGHTEHQKAQQISEKDASIAQSNDKDKSSEPVEEGEGIFGMFDEEGALDQSLPQSVVQIQKREKITAWGSYGEAPASKNVVATKKGSKSVPQVLITACPSELGFFVKTFFPMLSHGAHNCPSDISVFVLGNR